VTLQDKPPILTGAEPPYGDCIGCGTSTDRKSPTGHWVCIRCAVIADKTTSNLKTDGTLAQLVDISLPPIHWSIGDILPEGLTVLAGAPKLGKSWLALQWALAIASGTKAFGQYETTKGDVLYIALEDGERRMQSRAERLGALKMPVEDLRRFHYRITYPVLTRDGEGFEELDRWMQDHPHTRLIVADTWQKLCGPLPGKDKYAEEYSVLGRLQQFATKHNLAIILVHHLRKATSSDWIERVSGSQAVTGAADTVLGLFRERGQMDAVLRVTGREVNEQDLALQFDFGKWLLMGDAEEYALSVEQQEILQTIDDLGGEAAIKDISAAINKSLSTVSHLVSKLNKDNRVFKVSHGVYALNPLRTHSTRSTSTPNVEQVERIEWSSSDSSYPQEELGNNEPEEDPF